MTSVVHVGLSATRHTKHLPTYCHQSSKHLRLFWKRPGIGTERLYRKQVACCSFQFLISLIVAMKTLAVIKPISIKLEKKSNDIVKAYNMTLEREKELSQVRKNAETVFKAWYANAVDLGSDLGTKSSIPRTASRQRHRGNTPHDPPRRILPSGLVRSFP